MDASEFLKFIITSIVSHPEDVAVERKDDDLGTLLTLRVAQDDMGVLIGKEGKTINAIRTVLRTFGARHDLRLNLRIHEDR